MKASLAAFAQISNAELMRKRGLFVAEGRLVVRRVLEDARYHVHSLLLNEAARDDLADVLDRLPPGVPVEVLRARAFEAITGFNFHRGCLALVHRPNDVPVETILEGAGPVVILEDVGNADNVGGVFRNAAAFGARAVVLSPGCCDPLYRKAVRTSMAAVLAVPYARAGEFPAAIDAVRQAGFQIAALTPRRPSVPLERFAARSRGQKIALVLGTEGTGLSAAAEAAADTRITIPMVGGVDSLNLAVATGIALYALQRGLT